MLSSCGLSNRSVVCYPDVKADILASLLHKNTALHRNRNYVQLPKPYASTASKSKAPKEELRRQIEHDYCDERLKSRTQVNSVYGLNSQLTQRS